MRTNIEIDDDLIAEAMTATGLKTKKAAIDFALRELVLANRRREAIRALDGLGWDGDLDEMRADIPEDVSA
ncbi:type II toxin-antitoxin system VapB family antitoxin [Oryzibacter oryziterrae]|uniref:type II toxin-antitoxin system VapB family antitoxin n=1 Tax=Oryzibacter oryziterrae TaxID=2766474 RepID=UPI001F3CFEF0|nr:type II toxin-antitoxin system VapB family antitoxin [Oryzibacter oryziterrae]